MFIFHREDEAVKIRRFFSQDQTKSDNPAEIFYFCRNTEVRTDSFPKTCSPQGRAQRLETLKLGKLWR